jgi:hypothetical protein
MFIVAALFFCANAATHAGEFTSRPDCADSQGVVVTALALPVPLAHVRAAWLLSLSNRARRDIRQLSIMTRHRRRGILRSEVAEIRGRVRQ